MSLFKELGNFVKQIGTGTRYVSDMVAQGTTTPNSPWRDRGGAPAPVVANQPLTVITPATRSRESINTSTGGGEARRAGALLGGGDAGLQLDPLGRRGSGGAGRTALLGR